MKAVAEKPRLWDVLRGYLLGVPKELAFTPLGGVRGLIALEGRSWIGATRTPKGLHFGREGELFRGGALYDSRTEPTTSETYAVLTWGFGVMLNEATGRGALPSGWVPPGCLYEVFWGRDFLAAYWKNGPEDIIEIWTPTFSVPVVAAREPEAWRKLHETLLRNSHFYSPRLFLFEANFRNFAALLPLFVRHFLAERERPRIAPQ